MTKTHDAISVPADELAQLRSDAADAMTFALRLLAEDENTFAPETLRAMDRWRPRCIALLHGDESPRTDEYRPCGLSEDERLDDPRHGQAAHINKVIR